MRPISHMGPAICKMAQCYQCAILVLFCVHCYFDELTANILVVSGV